MGGYISAQAMGAEETGGKSNVVAVESKAHFDNLFGSHKDDNKMLVIDFSATWCGPCRMIEPILKTLSAKYSQAIFLKVDVDELPEVSKEWQVEVMPTFVIVKNGKEVTRVIGAKKDELERKMEMFKS